MDKDPGKIFAAMHAITADIGSIGKNNTNSFQKYNFRSVGQAMAALQPLLVKHRVVLQPTVIRYEMLEQEKGAGCVCVLNLNFYHVDDGSSIVVSSLGQGSDSGDKAAYKALAGAFKYGVFQTFCIPEDGVDAEFSEPEVKTVKKEHKLDSAPRRTARDILG